MNGCFSSETFTLKIIGQLEQTSDIELNISLSTPTNIPGARGN